MILENMDGKRKASTSNERPPKRKIRQEWFSKFKWLKLKDCNFYCEWCISSGRNNVMTQGKSSTAPKLDDFVKHEQSVDHKFATTARTEKASCAMAKATANTDVHMRDAIIAGMKNVYFMVKEDLAKSMVGKLNKHSLLQGCKHLEVLATDDRIKYSSYDSVNDMLHSLSEVIKEDLLAEIKKAKLYALLFDESTDSSVKQNLMIYVRYVVKGKVCTKFLSVASLIGCTAEDIQMKVKETLLENSMDPSALIALGTDGASTMTGVRSGVTTRMKQENPFVLSDHCGAHRLALAAGQAARTVPYLVDYQETVNAICKLFKCSPKQRTALTEIQDLVNDDHLTYNEVFETRWLSFSNCVQALRRTLDSLLTFLASSDNSKAKCLQKKVCRYKFIATTYLLSDSLKILSQLCLTFQRSNLLFNDMLLQAKVAIQALKSLKDDLTSGVHFNSLCDKLPEDFMSRNAFELHSHEIRFSEKQYNNTMSCGKQFLQALITNLEKRFLSDEADNTLFPLFEILAPYNMPESESDLISCGQNEILKLSEHFGQDKTNSNGDRLKAHVSPDELMSEWQSFKYFMVKHRAQSFSVFWNMVLQKYALSYENISLLAQIYMSLPSTTVDVERGFSRHNLVKTSLRSCLKSESVNDLLLIKIEDPDEDMFDFDKCYTKSISVKDRRIFLPNVAKKLESRAESS